MEVDHQQIKKQDLPAQYKGILGGHFYVLKKLGDGGNAKVYLGWDQNDNKQVAIKKMIHTNQKSWDMAIEEGKLMALVDHINVLKVIKYGSDEYVDEQTGNKEQWFYIALELAQIDTLFDYIVGCEPFPESLSVIYFEQFISGLSAIHDKGMCHRDIKCENILIDEKYDLKIADFGFAAPIAGKPYED